MLGLDVSIHGQYIEHVEFTKFLGDKFIDEKFHWKKHTSHIASKISMGLGAHR